jgi:hypothetical protein
MRDVTPKDPQNSHVPIQKIVQFLIEFAKNPVQSISLLPDWNWTSLFLLQVVVAFLSGTLAGLIKWAFYSVLFGIIIMPVVSTIAALLLALFLYYYFQFFEKRTEDFRRIFTLVILSSLPFYVFQILSEYFAPVTLIGFAFTSLLGVVGLTENFSVSKKRAYQLVGILFGLVVISWLLNRLTV